MNWAQTLARFKQRFQSHQNMLLFAGSNLLLQGTTLICHFIVLKWIPPELVGIWQTAVVVNGYLLISQFGIVGAMNREYPYFLGRGQRGKAVDIARTAQSYALANAALLGVVFLVLGVVYGRNGWHWSLAFWGMSMASALSVYTSYLEGTFRAGNEFRRLSGLRLLQVPVQLLVVLLPYYFGFVGFCARQVVVVLFLAGSCYIARPLRVGPGFRWSSLRLLISTGWRLFISNYLMATARSFPQLALVALGGTLSLGLFAPVSWMVVTISGIAGSFSAYLYPNMTYRYAQDGIPVHRLALKAAVLTMVLLLPLVFIGIPLLPWVISSLMPKYAPAILPAQITLVASLLECMSIAALTFAATKAWRMMFVYVGFSLAVRCAGAFGGCIIASDKLLGVAWGMLASSALMVPVTWWTVSGTRNIRPVLTEDESKP